MMETHIITIFTFRYSVPQQSLPEYININNYQPLVGFYCFICCHTLIYRIYSCRILLVILLVIIIIITGTYSCQKHTPMYIVMFNVLYVRTYGYWGEIFWDLLNYSLQKCKKQKKHPSQWVEIWDLIYIYYLGSVCESLSLPYFRAFVSSFPPFSIKLR